MRDIWFCKFCLHQSEIEHDGTKGWCLGCGIPVAKRQGMNDIFQEPWFPLAETLVGAASPIGGAALKSLERLDASNPSEWEQDLLNLAAFLIIGVTAGLVVRKLLR